MALPALLHGKLALPVIATPMHLVPSVDSVTTQCCAGLLGSFPARYARPGEQLDSWIAAIKSRVGAYAVAHPAQRVAPFAVEIAHVPRSERVRLDIEVCLRLRVPILITTHTPVPGLARQVHAYKGLLLHEVATAGQAEAALADGVDGLVLAAPEHAAGTLVQAIRRFHDGLLAIDRASGTGGDLLAAQAMGCDLVRLPGRVRHCAQAGDSLRGDYLAAQSALRRVLEAA